MNPFRALFCLVCIGTIGAFGACAGDDFGGSEGGSAGTDGDGSAGSSGSAGSTGGSAGSSAGGSAGSATGGAGGAAATGGSGGSGGSAPCIEGQCGDDSYCHSDGSCRKCTDFDEVDFGQPEAIPALNDYHSADLRWPRPVTGSNAMIYVVGTTYPTRKLWFTEDVTQNPGVALPWPLDAIETDGGDLVESGPLMTPPPGEGALAGMALFFDRGTSAFFVPGRRLWGAKYDGVKDEFLPPQELPAPFNVGTESSWDVAVAAGAKRVWFMSNRDGALNPKLYTAETAAAPSSNATSVALATLPLNCPVKDEFEIAPWVTPDGKILFFQSRETASGCAYGNKTDLFFTLLSAEGQAAGISAFPLPVNSPNTNEATPTLSSDMCWLYFSSDRELSSTLELYRARRI